MFDNKEDVERAVMELKIFGGGITDFGQNEGEIESEEINSAQIFPEHDELSDRYNKTLYYGKLPVTDRASLPLTQLAVDQFTSVGLDALGRKLGRLDVSRAAEMTRTACVGPSSLVLALLYLDRLRKRNPDYLTSISSADLFLVSMMVASKFLHDDGEEDEVFNDEWAQSGGMDTKDINNLEIDFLSAIDWRIFVGPDEFSQAVEKVETKVAMKEVSDRGWATYTEMETLSGANDLWRLCVELSVKVTAVCAAAYTAGFLSLLATTAVLERSAAGPSAVSQSVKTLSNLMTTRTSSDADFDFAAIVPDTEDVLKIETDAIEDMVNNPRVSAADLLKASLLVTSLSSGISTPQKTKKTKDYFDGDIIDNHDDNKTAAERNYSRSVWLAEVSFRDGDMEYDKKLGDWKLGSYQTLSDQNFDQLASDWKTILLTPQLPSHSLSYLGRCPVLRWGSSWMFDSRPMSFIQLNG